MAASSGGSWSAGQAGTSRVARATIGHADIGAAAGAVDDAGGADHLAPGRLDRLDAFARGKAGGDDVLDHGHAGARRDAEGAAEFQHPALALDIDRGHAELAGGLVARNDAADRRRDHHIDRAHPRLYQGSQRLAQPLAAIGVHEHQVLLQEDAAVQARGEDEMPLAQSAGGAEFLEHVFVGHGRADYTSRRPIVLA